MKKLLLLGGSAQQIIAIETAKRMGFYTVFCDYLPDNPGQQFSDKFYLVSTTDREKVLEVAKREQVSGVLAYASDPAAPTAAYVAEKLCLPTNPFASVEILCNKDKFRIFLQKNGFAVPQASGFTNVQDAVSFIQKTGFPVIIKPVDSSGSKGVTIVRGGKETDSALQFAFSASRSGRIVIEKFIEKKHKYLVGGDIFVINGKVTIWGLLNCHRDPQVNPLVPVGKSFPPLLHANELEKCKQTLQRLVDKLHIISGAMNVELIICEDEQVYLVDVGPRNGGNMIPDLLGMIFKIDVIEATIRCAVGEPLTLDTVTTSNCFMATHNLHTDIHGHFESVVFSEELNPHIVQSVIYKSPGDEVHYFDNSAKAIGIVFMKFDSKDQMLKITNNIHNHIQVIVRPL